MKTPKLGRTKGEREEILKDIINKYENGLSLEEIAKEYNVSKQAISLKMRNSGYYASKEAKRIKSEKIAKNLDKNTLEEITKLQLKVKSLKVEIIRLKNIIRELKQISPDEKGTYIQLINTFGEKAQVIIAIEELSELQKELCKYLRGDISIKNVSTEMADVEIMLEQLKIIFNNKDSITEEKAYKIQRTKDRYLTH